MRAVDAHVCHTVARLLSEYTGDEARLVATEAWEGQPGAQQRRLRSDLIVDAAGIRFIIETKASGAAAPVAAGLRALNAYRTALEGRDRGAHLNVPLLVVPFMGEVGQELCAEAGASWLDLAGNARIVAPGLRVWVDGRPNVAARRPSPVNPFAPRAARIPRCLLLAPERAWTQHALVEETGLDKGFVSKVVGALVGQELLAAERGRDGPAKAGAGSPRTLRVVDPDALLDAWREAYAFDKHDVHRGIVAARSGPELLDRLAARFGKSDGPAGRYAATGLAAASRLAPYADFRTVTFYCEELPRPGVLADLGFQEAERGGNVWLVVPNDAGVFDGAAPVEGVPCVSAVQTYLDLFAHPERARDAAAELRARCLSSRRWASAPQGSERRTAAPPGRQAGKP
jgi:hypothetical protein